MAIERITRIAHEVRVELQSWLKDKFREDLECTCGICSYTLYRVLCAVGYNAELVESVDNNEGHCWVEVGGYVVDLTATQFGYREVVFVRRIAAYNIFPGGVEFEENKYNYLKRGRPAVISVLGWGLGQSPREYMKHVDSLVRRFRNGGKKAIKKNNRSRT